MILSRQRNNYRDPRGAPAPVLGNVGDFLCKCDPNRSLPLRPTPLLIALLLAVSVRPAHAEKPFWNGTALCKPPEMVVFSCELERQTVSICENDAEDKLIYRYGRPGHIQLELPDVYYSAEGASGGAEELIPDLDPSLTSLSRSTFSAQIPISIRRNLRLDPPTRMTATILAALTFSFTVLPCWTATRPSLATSVAGCRE